MRVSVITWDAGFREHLHTVDVFCEQDLDKDDYEFIWVEFYNPNDHVREKIDSYSNARLLALEYPPEVKWHLGKCINKGVNASSGEILIIADGDIVVDSDFIKKAVHSHENQDNLVIYYRRYDELYRQDKSEKDVNVEEMEKVTRLINPLNYAGCYSIDRALFEAIGGYEEHDIYAGPGMSAYEFYIRLRNHGAKIQWSNERIYHPWHPSTGLSNVEMHKREALKAAKVQYPWINPYSGIEQSWVAHVREMNLSRVSSIEEVDSILNDLPNIDLENFKITEFVKEKKYLMNEITEFVKEKKYLMDRVDRLSKENSELNNLWIVKVYRKLFGSV